MKQLQNQQNSVGIIKQTINSLPNISSKELSIYNNDIALIKFKDYSTAKELALMTSLFVKWSNYLGIETPDATELNTICNFVKEHFENFNHQDLDNAIMMVITNSLNTDAEHYGKLSIIYIHKCLKEYVSYKGSVMVKIRQELEKQKQLQKQSISPEERIENLKKLIQYGKKDKKENKTFYDFGDSLYNFIKHNKLIKMDEEIINNAMEYGNKMFDEEKKRVSMESVLKSSYLKTTYDLNFEKEDKIKKFAREYVVNLWLEKLDVNAFFEKLNPEMLKY